MNQINVSRLVDDCKLRPFHFWLTFWCLLAMMADGFDLLNASIAGPAIIKEWNISRAAMGPVFSASLFGFFVGAPLFGFMGDRYGRKLTIVVSLIFLGLSTLVCAFARDLSRLGSCAKKQARHHRPATERTEEEPKKSQVLEG